MNENLLFLLLFLVKYLQNLRLTITLDHHTKVVVMHTMAATTVTHIIVVVVITHIAVANTHHHFDMDSLHFNLVIIDILLNFVAVDTVAAGPFVSFTFERTGIAVIIELIATALIAFTIATSYFLN